jgi:hypothetical protein
VKRLPGLIALCLLAAGCQEGLLPPPITVDVTLTASPTTVPVSGGSSTLTAKVTSDGQASSGVTVTFSLSPGTAGTLNPVTAQTDSAGQAKSVAAISSAAGTVTATAAAQGVTGTATITVQ